MFCWVSTWGRLIWAIVKEKEKTNPALGKSSKCMLLSVPCECKLFLITCDMDGKEHICQISAANYELEATLICSSRDTTSGMAAVIRITTRLSVWWSPSFFRIHLVLTGTILLN